MKTRTLLSAVIAACVLTSNSNAQIKLQSDGRVIVGAASSVPTYSTNLIYGISSQFGYGSNLVNIDLRNTNPRITNNSSSIVFYNSNNTGFIDIQVRTCYLNSDERNKTNITDLTNGLSVVKKLRGVSFQWKQDVAKKSSKKDCGFIAQEVEKVIDGAVISDDSTGNKMMSYSAIIPYLVEAIKEQQTQIDSLKKIISKTKVISTKSALIETGDKSGNNPTDVLTSEILSSASLDQNAPNPFNQSTGIGYSVPEEAGSAIINVYDLNGLQIKSYKLAQKGAGKLTIHGSEFLPGMYFYTLLVNGLEVDTKKMILTE